MTFMPIRCGGTDDGLAHITQRTHDTAFGGGLLVVIQERLRDPPEGSSGRK